MPLSGKIHWSVPRHALVAAQPERIEARTARLFHIEILGNRQAVAQRQFLMHNPNAKLTRPLRGKSTEIDRRAAYFQRSARPAL